MRTSRREDAPASLINSWILALQGSGDPELNKIVNELVQLRRQMASQPLSSTENRMLIGRIMSLTNQIRSIYDPRHEACLQQMQTKIREFTN